MKIALELLALNRPEADQNQQVDDEDIQFNIVPSRKRIYGTGEDRGDQGGIGRPPLQGAAASNCNGHRKEQDNIIDRHGPHCGC